jgi:multiple sugar transport system substrate-binding protein
MNMFRKPWPILIGALCAALLLQPAAPAQAAAVTLDVYYANPSFATFFDEIAQEFMKRNPDIEIKFRAPAPTYDVGQQTMLRQAITNQLPDVDFTSFSFMAELVHTLVKRDQIVDLGPLLQKEGADWVKANFSQSTLNLAKVDGKQFGMAFNASLPIAYVNADLVRKAGGDPDKMPADWAGTLELAKKIRATGGGVNGAGYSVQVWPDDWLWQAIVMQGGARMLDSSGTKVGFAGPAGLAALKLLRSIVTDAGMPLIDFDQAREAFVAGKTGIYFDTPARLKQVTGLVGTRFVLKTSVFPINDSANGGLPTGGNAGIITAKDPAKQKAAWEYLKFMTGPEAQTIVAKATGYMPLNLNATGPNYLKPFYEANPNFATVAKEVDRALPWQGYPGGNSVRIWRAQRDIINSVMSGDTTPEAGLKQIVDQTNALMQ